MADTKVDVTQPKPEEHASGFDVLRPFAPFFRPYKKQIFTWFLIYGAYFACGILTPIAVKIYFDTILPSHETSKLWFFVGAYAIFALVYHTLYLIGSQGTVRIIEAVVADLRLAVYRKLHRLTISYFDKVAKRTDDQPGEQTPIYSISFEMYENGISRALKLDYGDFVIDGKMTSLEVLPAKACQ